MELWVFSFEHVSKNGGIDVSKGKSLLIQAEDKVASALRQMHKKPESIRLRIAQQEQVADNEVDPLSIAHRREVV